ncbi:MAG TPA: SpoIIE family protein phosphatase [Xanthomonadales bacterium]|nr:SpoIIE family protein phosphatase [Xanthomonadales bacterium]
MPILVVESGPLAGERFSFARRAIVGRGQLADVRIEHETISRRHCEIRPHDAGYEVVDLGSANGTRLNGAPVAVSAPLAEGDRIELGMVTLTFSAEDDAPAAAAPGAGSALFHETLARIALFCELGELIAAAAGSDEQLARALGAVRRAYPRLDHAALLFHVAAGDRFTLAAGAGPGIDLDTIVPRAREGMRHERGHAAHDGAGLWAAVPVRYAGELLGVLYLASANDPEALRISDRDALCAIASLLAPLLAPARAPDAETASDDRDLALARRIQQRFLPQAPPVLPGFTIADSYTAARVVGGDHFDYLALADGRVALLVADVSGKAVSGALYMARLGPLLKQAAAQARAPAELLARINALLYPELEAGMFVTMLVVALDPASAQVEVASAGHPAPFKRHANAFVDVLDVPRGPPLGAMPGATFSASTSTLARGELLLLYTDGLDEAHDLRQSLFGAERIVATLAQTPGAGAAIEGLLAQVGAFVGDAAQSDDLTLVAIERQ